jgi:protein O-GlcNAc transferase
VTLNPSYATAWNNLGAVLVVRYKLDDAMQAIRRAIAINPNYASAYNNLANALQLKGNSKESIDACRKAIALKPGFADAYRTLGASYVAQREMRDAILCYQQVVNLDPSNATSHLTLAIACISCDLYEHGAQSLEHAFQLHSDDAMIHFYYGVIQNLRGYDVESEVAFARAIELDPRASFRIRHLLAIPPIMSSATEVRATRARLEAGLDEMIATLDGVIADPYGAQLGTNFYLAYHALNDRPIQEKISTLYRKVSPCLNYVAPHCAPNSTPRRAGRKRVGFFSRYIYKHSVARSFSRIVEHLSQHGEFDVFLISTTDHQTEGVREMYANLNGAFVRVPLNLENCQRYVGGLELDTLVYLDIGMDPLSFLLAFSRLAPVQCVMGGHPVTTGIATVDYFFSPAALEPIDAEDHYSEVLVRLQEFGGIFTKPTLPPSFRTRDELKLPLEGNLYMCPMMLQKLHPDFDDALDQILARDPMAQIVLFESQTHPRWGELIRSRLTAKIGVDRMARIHFLPFLADPDEFMSALSHAAVVLDPFHFGIGTTAIYVFAVGVPIVTWPGEFCRGRVGMFFAQTLGIEDCVAASRVEYPALATRIANDPQFRSSISERIFSNHEKFYDNDRAGIELVEVLAKLEPRPIRHTPR